MTAFSNARACGIGAVLLAGLSTVHAQGAPGGYPVTATQRATAQQVAQQGVPLSDLSASVSLRVRGDRRTVVMSCAPRPMRSRA